MTIELLTIGSEVLSGHILNTNARFIAQELLKEGYKLTRETTLADTESEISKHLSEAMQRSDFVIATGGLGPTIDDISGAVAAKTLGRSPEFIPNHLGSAPGLLFEVEGHLLAMLPGVPYEMQAMLLDEVLPLIKKKFPLTRKPYKEILHLTRLYETAVDPFLRQLKAEYPELEFGIYPSIGLLQIHVHSYSEERVNLAINRLKEAFADKIYDADSIEKAIQNLFIQNGWTLSVAESCTGGGIGAHITGISGASHYFLGSVVSYSDASKINILGVPFKLIEKYGAVSQEVVTEMVLGANRLFNSTFSIAVTGVAGPAGGTEEKPVGTVWFGMYQHGKEPITWKLEGKGNRSMITLRSINEILGQLYHYAKKEN